MRTQFLFSEFVPKNKNESQECSLNTFQATQSLDRKVGCSCISCLWRVDDWVNTREKFYNEIKQAAFEYGGDVDILPFYLERKELKSLFDFGSLMEFGYCS
ncbi:hypothetical protein QQP08_006060 [Theobroma cacao]|nr:hypothetical protein QQP08_006060 [Theobroma cacao]